MTKKQFRSFLIGAIMGDASLCGSIRNKHKHLYFVQVNQGYALWKKRIIEENLPVGIVFKQAKGMDYGYGKKRNPMWRCWTTGHHKLTALYKLLYPNGIKTISERVLRGIDGLGLAVWFMDDGCKETYMKNGIRKIKSFKISLWGKKKNIDLIPIWLEKKYRINSKIYWDRGRYPIVRISEKNSKDKFIALIGKYIIPEMRYKIQLQSDTLGIKQEITA
jgi:hypothetical protein